VVLLFGNSQKIVAEKLKYIVVLDLVEIRNNIIFCTAVWKEFMCTSVEEIQGIFKILVFLKSIIVQPNMYNHRYATFFCTIFFLHYFG